MPLTVELFLCLRNDLVDYYTVLNASVLLCHVPIKLSYNLCILYFIQK